MGRSLWVLLSLLLLQLQLPVMSGVVAGETGRTLRVLQFNIWQEGTMVEGGYEAVVDEIVRADADLVALSEVRNYYWRRLDKRLVKSLRKRGFRYYARTSEDSGLLSRYPIVEQSTLYPLQDDHGSITKARIDIDGVDVVFYSAHLDYLHYSCYLPRGYDGTAWHALAEPVVDIEKLRNDNAASMRDEAIDIFLADAKRELALGRRVLLAGDFNEPSHRDWTEATRDLYDHRGVVMPWRNTLALERAGFVDSYRELYPDPVSHPGFTFPADNPAVPVDKLTWAPRADERERIDYIFYYPDPGLRLVDSRIVGPDGSVVRGQRVAEQGRDVFDLPLGIWPSDHKALLSIFEMVK